MKLYCIGIGPGGAEQMTARAVRALETCDCVAGYGLYLDLIEQLIAGKTRIQTGMMREVDRCAAARDAAKEDVYKRQAQHRPARAGGRNARNDRDLDIRLTRA